MRAPRLPDPDEVKDRIRTAAVPDGYEIVTGGFVRVGDICSLSGVYWNKALIPDPDNPSGRVFPAGPFLTARKVARKRRGVGRKGR